jgi:ribosomal protein L5
MAATTAPRLKARYASEIRPGLLEEFKHGNVNEVARLTKIVVNMGSWTARSPTSPPSRGRSRR